MALKSFKADVQRLLTEAKDRFDNSLTVLIVGIVQSRRDAPDLPCVGWICDYPIAGHRRPLYFRGNASSAERLARELIDYAYQVEKPEGTRPAAVLMQQVTPPDDAVMVCQPPEGTTHPEQAARLYDAMRASE